MKKKKTGKKYIVIHTYKGLVDKVTGVPKGYGVLIQDYDEGRSGKVVVMHR
jgi:hypothetical protein